MQKVKVFISGIVLISAFASFGQGLYVSPGTKVTIESNTNLKLSAGDLYLASNDVHFPSLLQEGTIIIPDAGDCKVEQLLITDEWHIVSSPVNYSNASPYTGKYLMEYYEQTETWTYIVDETTPLVSGSGYFAWNPGSGKSNDKLSAESVIFSGDLNSSNVQVSLSFTSSISNPGWNILGNPFPCSLEWNGNPDWNLNNVGATIYIYDAGAGGGSSGNYRVFNYNNPPEAQIPEGNDGLITATQGFWIKATSIGASLTIPSSQRLHSSKPFYKATPESSDKILRLSVEDHKNGFHCESVVGFKDESHSSFDAAFDAYFIEGNPDAPMLFSTYVGEKFMVNFLPSLTDHKTIPLSFKSNSSQEFHLFVSGIESFDPGVPIFLEDKKDKVFYDLRLNPNYSFAHLPTYIPERFVIHFAEVEMPDDPTVLDQVHIYAVGKKIVIIFPVDCQGDVFVYNILGEQIYSNASQSGRIEIPIKDKQTYLVRVISEENFAIQKVCIY